MGKHEQPPRIHLPHGWPRRVKSASLHVIAATGTPRQAPRTPWVDSGAVSEVKRPGTIRRIPLPKQPIFVARTPAL